MKSNNEIKFKAELLVTISLETESDQKGVNMVKDDFIIGIYTLNGKITQPQSSRIILHVILCYENHRLSSLGSF